LLVLSGEGPGDGEPQERQLPRGTRLFRQPGKQRAAPVPRLAGPSRVEQSGDPLSCERRSQVRRRGARAGAASLQPGEPVGRVVDGGRRSSAAPLHDGPHQRHRGATELTRRAADRGPRRVCGVERTPDLVRGVLDGAPGLGAEDVGRELGVAVAHVHVCQ
jgi:hypothetical protein